jgi:23S rRNA G2445 N2-methylase RlmL
MPYLGGGILSKGILRLRPANAHLLLQMADMQNSGVEIVLDPCVGIGTIPVEAEQYFSGRRKNKQCVSIGGDLVLNSPKYTKIAGLLESVSRRIDCDDITNEIESSLLVAWDASHLPMRTSSVDIVISDLPIGQQCLSRDSLNQLLLLVFRECARVLTSKSGRMVREKE